MLKHLLIIGLRNMRRSPVTATLQIAGLTLGMTAFLLLFHYIMYERSYDRMHPAVHRLYRLQVQRFTEDGQASRFASCAPPAGDRIRKQFPEVETVARCLRYKVSMSYQDQAYVEENLFFAEPQLLKLLHFTVLQGDRGEGLALPGKAMISQSAAKKYFGSEEAVGRRLSLDKKHEFEVIGVFEDNDAQMHFKSDLLLSYISFDDVYGPDFQNAWGHTGVFTYLRLRPQTELVTLKEKLDALVDREFGEVLSAYHVKMELKPVPVTEIHLHSHVMQEIKSNGSAETVHILSGVAIFILLMAWVNYVNLSTSHALLRAREVGLRKVVGSRPMQLFIQFFMETALVTLLACFLSIVLSALALPAFQRMINLPAMASPWHEAAWWGMLGAVTVITLIASGIYPAFLLTRYQPVAVLQGQYGRSGEGRRLRNSLVVLQYSIALCILTGTVVMNRQVAFLRKKTLGINIDNTVVIRSPRVRGKSPETTFEAFKHALHAQAGVQAVCHVTEVPGRQIYWDAGGIRLKGQDENKGKTYYILGVDADFAAFFEAELLAGDSFQRQKGLNVQSIMLNETAAHLMGFDDAGEAVGAVVDYWGDFYTVIGVIRDYHQQSAKVAFAPQLYRYMPTGRDVRGQFALRLDAANVNETLQRIEALYKQFFPGNGFEPFFLDSYFSSQYQGDEILHQVFQLFSMIAIGMAVLGVIGLALFNTMRRKKEVGVRKIMGAGTSQMVTLLFLDYFYLILLAFFITLPVVIWGSRRFLMQYAYQTELNPIVFALPLGLVTLMSVAVVAAQVIKTARANPVEALRSE